LDVPVFEVLAAVGLIFGFWWNLMAFIWYICRQRIKSSKQI
jgi:hypothetical protein